MAWVQEIDKFEQTDMDEWTLDFLIGDGDDEREVGLRMRTGVAHELWRQLDRTIGAHYREGAALAEEYARENPGYDPAEAYDATDPKSPGFRDRMAAIYDNREGK